ncbi:hypothetical protein GUJ93_ZPchr0015g6721 [Zizania palustris]|uniref:Uncharacterized protein n=1 Tax=Zizania palustris TaxID=103762 RepID=A0A8J5W115_ZIZPA|nr:hypothetical protein GUJ93_ZPchr0015g6721 [Zizania palustris]
MTALDSGGVGPSGSDIWIILASSRFGPSGSRARTPLAPTGETASGSVGEAHATSTCPGASVSSIGTSSAPSWAGDLISAIECPLSSHTTKALISSAKASYDARYASDSSSDGMRLWRGEGDFKWAKDFGLRATFFDGVFKMLEVPTSAFLFLGTDSATLKFGRGWGSIPSAHHTLLNLSLDPTSSSLRSLSTAVGALTNFSAT